MLRSRTISIAIHRPFDEVYEFLAEPRNFPSWASNLGTDFKRITDYEWSTTTRSGRVILQFAPRNDYGVLDHAIYLEGKPPLTTPMRLIPNEKGCEVLYTQFQRLGMSDDAFESEVEWVTSDFEALRSLLESGATNEVVFHDEGDEPK